MKENSIEEDMIILGAFNLAPSLRHISETEFKGVQRALDNILSDYKRVLKENETYKKNSEIMSKENLSTSEQLKVEIKENFRLKNQLENNRKEYQETYKDVREELKELKKENEELQEAYKSEKKMKNEYVKLYQDLLLEENVIPVQKVKDNIEKLNDESHAEELEDIMIGKNYTITELVQYVLQELIEESEEK